MSQPLVTCIIPCYNRPAYVRDAIESALAQTYTALEVIVIDDGSTDDTPAVLASYGDRIRVLTQENGGSSAARNAGIAASAAPYLAWLDSDDAWLPEKIAVQVDVLEAHPEAGVAYTRCVDMDENGHPPAQPAPAIPPAVVRSDMLRLMVVESEVMPVSCLVRREALDEVGLFDPSYRFAEDWELNFRLARRYPFAYIDAPLSRVRIHPDRKTTSRWPHAQGQLMLRAAIEAARPELLAADPSPEMREALRRHDRKYAEAYYRIGRLELGRGDPAAARDNLRESMRRDPWLFKARTRYWEACLRSLGRGAGDRGA
jgi:glycosyltransferase involved in cell wall biosynthesis